MDEIEGLKNKLIQLRRKCQDTINGENKVTKFGNIQYHKDMKPQLLDSNDLILGHVYLHNIYVKKEQKLSKEIIEFLHKSFVDEMNKRKMPHHIFDELDKKTKC